MNIPIYLDTNVVMDYLLDRDPSVKELIMKAAKCQYFILLSTLVLRELAYQGLEEETKGFLQLLQFCKKLQIQTVLQQDKRDAEPLFRNNKTDYNDALHGGKEIRSTICCYEKHQRLHRIRHSCKKT